MFKNDKVITDEDVGNFVKKLHDEGEPLKAIIRGVTDDEELVGRSTEATTRTQDTD